MTPDGTESPEDRERRAWSAYLARGDADPAVRDEWRAAIEAIETSRQDRHVR